MKSYRKLALILLVVFGTAFGAVGYILSDYLQYDRFTTMLIQLGLAIGCTSMISLWCWNDSKITETPLPKMSVIIMAIGGFMTVSGYFYRRLGPRGWIKSIFGLWQFLVAYISSIAGSYAAYAIVLFLHSSPQK
jgi:hypothetical protein